MAGPRDHDAPSAPPRDVDLFAPRPPEGLSAIVAALRVARDETNIRHTGRIHEIPTRASITRMLEGARTVLFPSHFGGTELDEETLDFFVGSTLHGVLARLFEDARRSLAFASDPSKVSERELAQRAQRFVDDVAGSLPTLRRLAVGDLEAARAVDVTGAGLSELLVSDPVAIGPGVVVAEGTVLGLGSR